MRPMPSPPGGASAMELASRAASDCTQGEEDGTDAAGDNAPQTLARRKTNRVRWLKLNFTVKAARLQTLKRQKYQHLQEEALLKARGLLENWENGVVVLTEDLYRRAAGERDAQELMNYTPEALALRFSLRNDPQVLEAVKELWQTEMPRDMMGCIDQRGYASVFRRIAKSLDAKAFRKRQKLDKLLDEDWKRDSKGEATMSFATFFDSIFELADLWCETIDVEDYVDFLERLRDRISHHRNGRRIFKPMKKVLAFDADSSYEEEEEEEEDGDEAETDSERAKPEPAPAQPRILVAKAIRPTPVQQPAQTTSIVRKVTRVAMSSKTITSRKEVAKSTATRASISTPTVSPTSVERGVERAPEPMPRASGMALGEAASNLLLHQASMAPGMVPSRQRRASVVTTIQLLDGGFVRSVSESINNGVSEGANRPSSGVSLSTTQVHVAVPRAMTSAAAAAAAVAAFRRQRDVHTMHTSCATLASTRNSTQTGGHKNLSGIVERPDEAARHTASQMSGERKRVITVSTAKRAMLKSIVLSQKRGGDRETEGVDAEQVGAQQAYGVGEHHSNTEGRDTSTNSSRRGSDVMDGLEGTAQSATNELTRNADPAPRALRMRAGSAFGLDGPSVGRGVNRKSVVAPKGIRVGVRDSTKLKNRGLAPLATPGRPDITAMSLGEAIGKYANTLTAAPQRGPGPNGSVSVKGVGGSGGFAPDFSDSVVMTSYVVERPPSTATLARPATTTPAPAARKPQLPLAAPTDNPSALTADAAQRGVVRGTRAIAKPVEVLEAKIENPPETIKPRPMVVVVTEPQATEQQPLPHRELDTSHGFAGHALHSVVGAGKQHALAEGSMEQVLRIKAAVDSQHPAANHATGHLIVSHERIYDHTDVSETLPTASTHDPGVLSRSIDGRVSVQPPPLIPCKAKPRVIDPIATPWDTSDDENEVRIVTADGGASARSLLRPESAMDALARVRNKRAASLSAGSSRNSSRTGSSSVKQRPRRRSRGTHRQSDSGEDSEDGERDEQSTRRTRALVVSPLEGSSVDSTASTRLSKRYRRCDHSSNSSSDDESGRTNQGMRESISAPVLSSVTQLELDYVRTSATRAATRATTPSIRVPMLRPVQTSRLDSLKLAGGHMTVDLTRSPPRSPPASSVKRQSPPKACSCAAKRTVEDGDDHCSNSNSWPPPVYRLEKRTDAEDRGDVSSPGKCSFCSARNDSEAATIIVNVQRELLLVPTSKATEILADATRALPARSEMMRRRHRYTRGKPL